MGERVLQEEEVVEQQGVPLKGGGPGRARSWLEEEEGRGSKDGRGQRRLGERRKRTAGPWQSRRQSGWRGWLGEEGEGLVGCSILGWWRAGH